MFNRRCSPLQYEQYIANLNLLIRASSACDNASQPHWPHEHSIADVVSRLAGMYAYRRRLTKNDNVRLTDVLITEGVWRRYGRAETWAICHSLDMTETTTDQQKQDLQYPPSHA